MNTCPCNTVSFQDCVELDTLLRHVIPVVPEIPHSMALDRLRQAYIDLARRSNIVTTKLVYDYQAGVTDYLLIPPEGYQIYIVQGMEHHGGFWWYDSTSGFIGGLQNSWGGALRGRNGFYMTASNVLNLYETPSADQVGGLVVYVTLIPLDCVQSMPIDISVPFGNGIAQKVISDALRIPNKPWTSPSLAKSYEMEFNRTVLDAKRLASANRQRGPLKARPVRIV